MLNYPFRTLPDYLAPGLKLVFVGINPGVYSVEHGHYFSRLTNRFWPAFSRSILSEEIRLALGREVLGPADDASLIDFGIGVTDVVKRPGPNSAAVTQEDYRDGAPKLLEKLRHFQPKVACLHGVTAYRGFAANALGLMDKDIKLGLQPVLVGETRLFVVPNPSPANAHFRLEDQIAWYDRLAEYLRSL